MFLAPLIALFFFGLVFFVVLNVGKRLLATIEQTSGIVPLPKTFALSAGIVVIAFELFVYEIFLYPVFPGVAVSLFSLALLIGIWLAFPAERRQSRVTTALVVFGGLVSLGLFWRDNEFVRTVNLLSLVGVFALLKIQYLTPGLEWRGLWLVRQVVMAVPTALWRVGAWWQNRNQLAQFSEKSSVMRVVKVAGLSVLVLIIFVPLLSMADPIFSQLVSELWSQLIWRVIWGLALVIGLSIVLSLQVRQSEEPEKLPWLSVLDVLIPSLVLAAVFGLFLFVQAKYLFASHEAFLEFGFTYSEYVNKGFIELLLTTFIGGMVVYAIVLKLRELQVGTEQRALQFASGLLVVELSLVLASALKRNLLYIQAYGLTRPRLVGAMFMGWLALELILLLVWAVRTRFRERDFLLGVGILTAALVLSYNVVNLDAVVTRFQARDESQNPDYFYNSLLSADAVHNWDQIIIDAEELLDSELWRSIAVTNAEFERGDRRLPGIPEAEISQIARVKLALMRLQERQLYLTAKYAPDEVVAREAYESYLGKQLTAKYTRYRLLDTEKGQSDFAYLRSRLAYSVSEQRAYHYVSSQADLYEQRLPRLLERLQNFEKGSPIPVLRQLYKKEDSVLYDHNYPLTPQKFEYSPQMKLREIELEERELRPASPLPSASPVPVR